MAFGAVPVVEAKKPLQVKGGDAFRPYGTDAIGRVHGVSAAVSFSYDHAPDRVWSMPAWQFTNYFAALLPGYRGRL